MKRRTSFKGYYEEYLDVCSSIPAASKNLDLLKSIKKEDSGRSLSLPFGTCLMDYSNKVYSYLSENCDEIISYSKEEYKEGGPDFHARNFHPDDKVVFTEQVFRDISLFWKSIPNEQMNTYRFSFNHRYFRKDGTISQLLQQSNYLEPNNEGIPVLNFLTFSDIGDFKTDTSLVLTISRLVNGLGYIKVFSKSYTQRENSVLSKRETEILQLCYDGLSSKMIAEKLFISVQTVKNHKRNMMEKASAANITGVIKLGIKNNWI